MRKRGHTNLERYWLKSLFPSSSSLHSSKGSKDVAVPEVTFFLSILRKETSNIAAQTSSVMNKETHFLSLSIGPPPNPKLPTERLSPETCAMDFPFDDGSLSNACQQ